MGCFRPTGTTDIGRTWTLSEIKTFWKNSGKVEMLPGKFGHHSEPVGYVPIWINYFALSPSGSNNKLQ
jgi:hypothetical protein